MPVKTNSFTLILLLLALLYIIILKYGCPPNNAQRASKRVIRRLMSLFPTGTWDYCFEWSEAPHWCRLLLIMFDQHKRFNYYYYWLLFCFFSDDLVVGPVYKTIIIVIVIIIIVVIIIIIIITEIIIIIIITTKSLVPCLVSRHHVVERHLMHDSK
jgi:hypothetical protein